MIIEKCDNLISDVDLRDLVDSVDQLFYTINLCDCKFVCLNKYIDQLTGYSLDQFENLTNGWADIVFAKDIKSYHNNIKCAVEQGGSYSFEYRIKNSDDSIGFVVDSGKVIRDENEIPTKLVGSISSNSEFKRAENELSRTKKLQMLGKLAAGVAHEINTPIQFIGDNMQFLQGAFSQLSVALKSLEELVKRDGRKESDLQDVLEQSEIDFLSDEIPLALEQSQDGISRVSTMISAMRNFSHMDERRKVAADINKAIDNAVVILRNDIKYIADVKFDLDWDMPKVVCCIDQINQVLMNLVINAAHSIEAKNLSGGRGCIEISTKQKDKNVVIKISDDGSGIPEDIQSKVFDAFFTTKELGKGTGQGLSISRSIICKNHKGKISFDTKDNEGTTFVIELPIDQNYSERK